MYPIVTLTDQCRKCYSCVRSCPVKAIKVEKSYTEIIFDRCIGCGNCLSHCPQEAKVIADNVKMTELLLDSGEPVVAVLGCSFPAFFHYATPGQLAAGLKQVGFAEVHEGAMGAELIAGGYLEAIGNSDGPLCSQVPVGSFCEGDASDGCGQSDATDNCGGFDWYFKTGN